MAVAIVNFRTLPNGAYTWIKPGQRRGYWRVMLVHDPEGPLVVGTPNVIGVPECGRDGIDGVTRRSAYYVGGEFAHLCRVAERMNAATLAQALARAYAPMPEGASWA